MSFKQHENIRIQVIQLLRNVLKVVAERRFKVYQDLQTAVLMRLLDIPEVIILVPQELYVSSSEKKTIDMALGNSIVFEFKSTEREFDQAVRDVKEKYWQLVSKAQYYIVTNYLKWCIYRISGSELALIFEGDVDKAREILETQIIPGIPQIKMYPLPGNVATLYRLDVDRILEELKSIFDTLKEDPRVKPLFGAYKNIMKMLYGSAEELFFEDLFIKHTYMHIAVVASITIALGKRGNLEDVCSGSLLNVDVALPYLNWWKIALHDEKLRDKLRDVLKDVVMRTGLIDWSAGLTEDVFRILYEFLIEPDTRRRIGEYYTPLWMVDSMLRAFDLRKKVVLDPFCGSGTFLVTAFYRKVDLGEDVDQAFDSIVGYDINPLAISVARAELIIAYLRKTGKEPEEPPHIYHVDTLAMWFGQEWESMYMTEIRDLSRKAGSYLQILINFKIVDPGRTVDILRKLREIEKALTLSIRFSYNECKLNAECLEKKIQEYLEDMLEDSKDGFISSFLKHFSKDEVPKTIASLIQKYGGNDVWGVVLISIYAPILLTKFKPDIIVTNPPWIPVTEYKAPYSEMIKKYMLDKIRKHVGRKAGQVLTGADISAAALGKSIELVNDGVAYIMNREQLFYHKTSSPAGILATYCILKAVKPKQLKFFDVDFDAFQHGIYPAIVVVKK